MTGLRRALRRAAVEERGLTLVELLMAMGLLSLVLAAAGAALASYQRTAASSDIRLENLAEAQTIMDVVSRDIRTAVTGQVIEEAIEPTGSPPYSYTGTPKVRIVGRHFANAPTQPLLTYLDENGSVLGPAPLTADERLQIDSVRIDLSIRKSNNLAVAPTTVRTTVRLPNVEYTPVTTP